MSPSSDRPGQRGGAVTSARVYIACRPEDAGGYAGRLHDALRQYLTGARILMGVEGAPWVSAVEAVERVVASCQAVLVVIGPAWLNAVEHDGRRHLDDPADPVRVAIESAFRHGLLVVPILVGDASMPRAEDLPEAVRGLAHRNALAVNDAAWRDGIERLIGVLQPPEPRRYGQDIVEARPEPHPVAAPSMPPAWPTPSAQPPPPPPEPTPTSVPIPWAGDAPPASPRRGGWWRRLAGRRDRPRSPGKGRVVAPQPASTPPPRPEPADLPDVAVEAAGSEADTDRPGDLVRCSAFAQPAAAPGSSIVVQVFAHLAEQAGEASRLAGEFDPDARRRVVRTLLARVPRETELLLDLRTSNPDARVDDPVQSLVWRGMPESVQFGLSLLSSITPGPIVCTVGVRLHGVPIGHLKFGLQVRATVPSADRAPVPAGDDARRYRMAFISHAAADRDKVLARVQMLRLEGIGFFQDVLDLEPGERWERSLYRHIDEADLFLLFWSSAAKGSPWVRREVAYALARRGGDDLSPPEIHPVIVEGPPVIPPWEELAHLHFNDPLLYFMGR